MRDDLHKGAPVPRPYGWLIKACAAREPDGGARAAQKAHEAVVAEVNVEMSPRFIRQLVAVVAAPQLSLTPPSLADLGLGHAELSTLQRRVVEHLPRVMAMGQ